MCEGPLPQARAVPGSPATFSVMTSDCVTGRPLSRHLWVPTECAVAGLAGRDMTRRRCYSSSVSSGERRFCPRNEATLLVLAEPGPGGQGQGRPCLLPRPPAPRLLLCRTNWHEGFLFCLGSGGLEARGEPRGQLPSPSSRGALGNVAAGSQRSPWGGGARPSHAWQGGSWLPPLTFQVDPQPRTRHTHVLLCSSLKRKLEKATQLGPRRLSLLTAWGAPRPCRLGPLWLPSPSKGTGGPPPRGEGRGGVSTGPVSTKLTKRTLRTGVRTSP